MLESDKQKRVGKYGIDLGKRGTYDERNKLNELTGKEWVYFTNSVWITGYSPTSNDNAGLKYRKIHPSPKPPGLIKDIVLFFTKSNALVFDPFAGVGGTLIGTALAGGNRNAIGLELSNDYVEAYKEACISEGIQVMPMIVDNAENMMNHDDVKNNEFDLIVADPPYSDMLKRARTGKHAKASKEKNSKYAYSDIDEDLANLNRDEYLIKLKKIITLASSRLKEKKYLVLFCKDFQPEKDSPNILHADIINVLSTIPVLQYKGMRIWHDQAMSLYPFGYPYSFVMNQIHQYILIFRKE